MVQELFSWYEDRIGQPKNLADAEKKLEDMGFTFFGASDQFEQLGGVACQVYTNDMDPNIRFLCTEYRVYAQTRNSVDQEWSFGTELPLLVVISYQEQEWVEGGTEAGEGTGEIVQGVELVLSAKHVFLLIALTIVVSSTVCSILSYAIHANFK